MKFKLTLVHLLIFSMWSVLILRCFQLQILPNKKLKEKINSQFITKIHVSSRRGDILDKNGKILATSVVAPSIFIDPSMVKQPKIAAIKLSKALGLDKKNILKKIRKRNRFAWIKRKINDVEYKKVIDLKLKSVGYIEEYRRVYLNESSTSFLLGKVNTDGQGISGLELEYNEVLKGDPIQYKALKDGRGRLLVFSNFNVLENRKGGDLQLNLDIETQVFIKEALAKKVKLSKAKRAWAVVMDVETGGILASSQIGSSTKNIAVSEIHEPGSVLKTFSFLKAMKDLNIKPYQKFPCGNKGFKIKGTRIRNSHKEDCKTISLKGAFAKSLNTVSSDLALKLGAKNLVSFYKSLGFSEKTHIDFPGEAKPIFHHKLTGPHHLASLSFGHGISLNTLQVLKAYSSIGKAGKMVDPHYVLKTTRNGTTQTYQGKDHAPVISAKDIVMTKGLLSSVVSPQGTAFKAKVENYLIGGKTGTSQKADFKNGGYSDEVLSSFVGLFPLSQPKYVALVSFDEPQSPRSGGSLAAPVFSDLAEYILRKEQVVPDQIEGDSLRSLTSLFNVEGETLQKNSLIQNGKVPDLRGYSLREALKIAKDFGVKLSFKGYGKISKVSPAPGRPIPKSGVLNLDLKMH